MSKIEERFLDHMQDLVNAAETPQLDRSGGAGETPDSEAKSLAPNFLKLWICTHCLSPRLYGSRTDCHVCGALLHDTAEYGRINPPKSDEHATGEATKALAEAHRRLDAAGVTHAQNTVCDDPTCQSLVGHRIQTLVAERDELKAENARLREIGLDLVDERERLKEHIRDLNADFESSNKHCDEYHVDRRSL